jgi:hypothetical protein
MQTRFQIREIDLSKGYCLRVTDKNHTQVSFGFENLDAQVQRLEQFLVYSDDSKQELATVNLLVQRNIPVTFGKPAVDVINDSIDPNEQPRVMKALPVDGNPLKANGNPPKFGTFSAPKPESTSAASARKSSPGSAGKTHVKASSTEVRRAEPVDQGKKK